MVKCPHDLSRVPFGVARHRFWWRVDAWKRCAAMRKRSPSQLSVQSSTQKASCNRPLCWLQANQIASIRAKLNGSSPQKTARPLVQIQSAPNPFARMALGVVAQMDRAGRPMRVTQQSRAVGQPARLIIWRPWVRVPPLQQTLGCSTFFGWQGVWRPPPVLSDQAKVIQR